MRKQLFFLGIAFGLIFSLGLLQKYIVATSEPVRPNDDETEQKGEREHTEGQDCWCGPTLFFEGGDEYSDIWVHKGNGEEMPPAWILVQALREAMFGDKEA